MRKRWDQRRGNSAEVYHELRKRGTSGPIPKLVNARGIIWYELRNLRTTSNSMNLVRLLNLRFLNELAATSDRNLKFAALEQVSVEWGHGACREHGLLPLPAGERGGVRGLRTIDSAVPPHPRPLHV